MRTTTVLALAAATAATTTLAKNAGGFQLLYTSSANVSWCVQPRAEDDNGNPREPQVGDQLIFDDCHYAVEGLKRGQIWRWSGNQLQSGTNSSFCIGLGERVVLAFCGKDEDDQGEDGDGQGEDDGDNEAAGAMAPKITVAASLIDYQGLGLPPPGSATKDAAEAHGTVGASSDAVKKTDVKTKWLFPQDGKLCVSKDECISAQHPQDAPTSITPALTISDHNYAADIGFARAVNPYGVDAASQAGAGGVGGGVGVQNQSGSAQGRKVPPTNETETENEGEKNTKSHGDFGRFGRIGLPAKVWQDDGGKTDDEAKDST